jgi:hypothetical protein
MPLQDRNITYSQAVEDETNVIQQLKAVKQKTQFYDYLSQHEDNIRRLTSHHLGFGSSERCVIRFNVCIPVDDKITGRTVLI